MNKVRKGLRITFSIFTLLCFALLIYSAIYFDNLYRRLSPLVLDKKENVMMTSYILNDSDSVVKTINNTHKLYIEYQDLPDDFINALVSIEDGAFFTHPGFDIKRISKSFFNNLKAGEITAGGSTLSQQLIKNITLSDEQSYERKLKEAILAYKLEQTYSKEEIMTAYCNTISFEGTRSGVNYASIRFFNKPINEVTLPEAALLAALVKSPTIYNPLNYPMRANERKNLVLTQMNKNGYISEEERIIASALDVEDLLYKNEGSSRAYDYQSYFDVVYQEVNELSGLDPYSTPMKIYTYLNEELQTLLDTIQKNEHQEIKFNDDEQNIGGAVIDNQSGGVVGILGGRDYNGEKLYNHAYDMLQQPASSIKPILSYALAYQHLNWSSAHLLSDTPSTYPNTNIQISNVDGQYLGDILIEDAIGYSRNTVAVKTLNEVVKKIGMAKVAEYLQTLNLLDVSPDLLNYSYALGGMYHGVSPFNLAGAYAMIANYGQYIKPTTVKKIELSDGTIIENKREVTQVLDEASGFLIANSLVNVIEKNYWGIGSVKVDNVSIGGKTGTSSFDAKAAVGYDYPINANKDIWFAGFSPDYSLAIWTGFDRFSKDVPNYFKPSGDTRIRIPRNIFRIVMGKMASPHLKFSVPGNIVKVDVIKGTDLLPLDFIDKKYIITAYYKQDFVPTTTFVAPALPKLDKLELFYFLDSLEIHFPEAKQEINDVTYGKVIYSPEELLGKIQYGLIVKKNGITSTYTSENNVISIPYDLFSDYTIEGYYYYAKAPQLTSNYYLLNLSVWD